MKNYVCNINDLSKSKTHKIAEEDWNFFDFLSFPYKQYLVKFIKEYLDEITNESSENMIFLTELNSIQCIPYREYFINVGYTSVLFKGYMWYYLDDYRISKFVNNGPLLVIDCCNNYGRHIYFHNENSTIITEVHTEELSKEFVVKKMFEMVSKEYNQIYHIKISDNKALSTKILRNCEGAYDDIKSGISCVSITLEFENRRINLCFKDMNIRYIEQQIVLNQIRNYLHLTTNRVHEVGIVLMGEGLYYDVCSSELERNDFAEKVTRLQPLSSPCFAKLCTVDNTNYQVTSSNVYTIRSVLKSFNSSNSSTVYWKAYADEDYCLEVKEIIKQDCYTCTLQNKNENVYSLHLVLPKEVWKHETSKGHFLPLSKLSSQNYQVFMKQSTLSTPLLSYSIASIQPSIPSSFDDLQKFQQNQLLLFSIFYPCNSSLSYHEIPSYPYYWYSLQQDSSILHQSYHQQQLLFNGQMNSQNQLSGHFYSPQTNCSSYILSNKVLYKQDDWCEEYQNMQSNYHICNQFACFTYQTHHYSLYGDIDGNINICCAGLTIHLGTGRAKQYPSIKPVDETVNTVSKETLEDEENQHDDIMTKVLQDHQDVAFQWSTLGGNYLENSWIQNIYDMFKSEVDDDCTGDRLTLFLQAAKSVFRNHFSTQQLNDSIQFEDIDLDEDEEIIEDVSFLLVLHEEDDITRLNGFTFDFTKGCTEGRLVTQQGDMVFCGEVLNKKLHGKGSWFYKTGAKCYEGMFMNNLKHGKGKFYYPNGTLMYDGEWERDFMNGEGRLFKPVNLKYTNSDIRRYLISHADKSDSISLARRYDIYSLGSSL